MERNSAFGVRVCGDAIILIGLYHLFYTIRFLIYSELTVSLVDLFIWIPFTGPALAFIFSAGHLMIGINILRLKENARKTAVIWSVIFAVILFLLTILLGRGLPDMAKGIGCFGSCPPNHYKNALLQFFLFIIFCCSYSLIAFYLSLPQAKKQFKLPS